MTSGLRRVTDDMKTKNRPDRSGVVPTPPTSIGGARPAAAAAAAPTRPPRWACQRAVCVQDNCNLRAGLHCLLLAAKRIAVHFVLASGVSCVAVAGAVTVHVTAHTCSCSFCTGLVHALQ